MLKRQAINLSKALGKKNSIYSLIFNRMANCHKLFLEFDQNLNITKTKKDKLKISKDNLRDRIRSYFKDNHSNYTPQFYIQGSRKMGTTIRTKDDTCDLDDGVYFISNPDNVTGKTLQSWVKNAVDGTTNATPSHKKKCITVDYSAGYNIDLPILIYDKDEDDHPLLAIKGEDFGDDDPKEFVDHFFDTKKLSHKGAQLVRIIKYLKAWCDYKRNKMPSGLAMTVLAMDHMMKNERDDIAFKFVLVEIETALKSNFKCVMPTTPKDDLFLDYDDTRERNFMNNLADFIKDAKSAIDEKNEAKACKLWRKHLGDKYFPEGEDKDEETTNSSSLAGIIGGAIPYYNL
ncbi:MAG: hypothetical protein JEZ14_11975 [Marinilabiliaceae bacterium]|nr:hypothetical protein [Marinilabiliaceae bacterium]